MQFRVIGPFINPIWADADEKMKKHYDRWAYSINGHRFTHPTEDGARKMMAKPEAHAEVISFFCPNS